MQDIYSRVGVELLMFPMYISTDGLTLDHLITVSKKQANQAAVLALQQLR